MSYLGLEGKKVLVTGAGSGIGQATVRRFVEEGALVALNDLTQEAMAETAHLLEEHGQQPVSVPADVSDLSQVREMVDKLMGAWGRIDILVNNAGITQDSLIVNMAEEIWDKVLAVNLKSVFNCTREVGRQMQQQGYGKVISVASIAVVGNIGTANYNASKAGVISFSKTAALEMARYGVTVNCVSPGFVETKMASKLPSDLKQRVVNRIPLQRTAVPQDIAEAILFLASDRSGYITGHTLVVDGGITLGYI